MYFYFSVEKCPAPPTARDNATMVRVDDTDPAVIFVEYACDRGYVPVSDPVIVCTRGVYNNTGLKCAKQCQVTLDLLPG